jgi:Holliday junction resolvase RusA-like endonuclease
MERKIFLALPPRATARTRCGCRGRFPNVYNEPAYKAWKDEAIQQIRELEPPFPLDAPFEGDVWVAVEVVVRKPTSTKKTRPKGDRDNFEKGVFDAITQAGGWWKDDDQIVEGPFLKRWAADDEPEGYKVTVRFRDGA